MMRPYRKCVSIVLKKNDLIFVGERVDCSDAWQLPQGGVNDGEGYEEAARRELLEETGVFSVKYINKTERLYTYKFPGYCYNVMKSKYGEVKYVGQELCFVEFEFTGDDSEINLKHDTVEFKNWKWVTAETVLNNIVKFKYQSYQKAFSELNLIS